MKKGLLFLFILIGGLTRVHATADGDSTKKCVQIWKENHMVDLSLTVGNNIMISSLQWDKLFALGFTKKRLKVGFGARMNISNFWDYSMFTGKPQRTAPGIFDTLVMKHQTTYFLNLQFIAEVALLKWWDIGMNIDLVGVSWGPKAEGSYYSHASGDSASLQLAQPENLNLMLFGNNDFGSLNSQFYMRFWPAKNLCIKGGMSLAVFTSLTENGLNNGNNRFHNGSYMGFISLAWTPGRNAWVPVKKKPRTIITPSF